MESAIKEITEYKLSKEEIEEIILKALYTGIEKDAFNSVVFKWTINTKHNELIGVFLTTEKITG